MAPRCRMCLKEYEDDDDLNSMLTTCNDSVNLWTMYDYIMNVGDIVDSAFVPYICLKCKDDLESAYFFKLMCAETEKTLNELPKNYQSGSDSEIEYVLYDDKCTDDGNVEVNVGEDDPDEYEAEFLEDHLETLTGDCVDDNVEINIAENYNTNDEDYWNESVDKNINRIVTVEDIGECMEPEIKSHECRVCDKKFEDVKTYQAHYRQFHRRAYRRIVRKENVRTCPQCNINFENVNLYQSHYRRYHSRQVAVNDPVPKILCPHCGKLLSKNSIGKHFQNVHSAKKKDHPCHKCGRIFKSIENLIQHKRIHSNDKRYACDICGEKFLHWASRRNHIITRHTGEKKYECHVCGQKFAYSSGMYRHVRRHRNELPHCCTTCSKRFLTKTELNNHQIVHTKEKKEICEICKKAFGTRNNLKAHMKIHSGEKNYVCSVCGKRFLQPHVLRTHWKTHPGVVIPERGVVLSQKALSRIEIVSNVLIHEN